MNNEIICPNCGNPGIEVNDGQCYCPECEEEWEGSTFFQPSILPNLHIFSIIYQFHLYLLVD